MRELTEAEWDRVFKARCKSKRGEVDAVSDEDRTLINHAYKSDPKRYKTMESAVFNATVPFGSNVRMGDRKMKKTTKLITGGRNAGGATAEHNRKASIRNGKTKPKRERRIVGDKGTKVWAAIRVDNLARMQHEMKHDRSKVDLEAANLVRTLGRMLEVVGDSAGSNYAYWIATQLETRP